MRLRLHSILTESVVPNVVEVNITEAKTHLSRLLRRVAAGEVVVISKAGVPIARLVSVQGPGRERTLGEDVGKGWIADDFDAPLQFC